jgi:hypothetical protein
MEEEGKNTQHTECSISRATSFWYGLLGIHLILSAVLSAAGPYQCMNPARIPGIRY